MKDRAELLQTKLALLPQVHHACGEGDEEGGVCEEQTRRVNWEEPRRAAVRHAACDHARVAADNLRGEDEQRDNGEQQRAERADAVAVRDQAEGHDERPREKRQSLRQTEERVVSVTR